MLTTTLRRTVRALMLLPITLVAACAQHGAGGPGSASPTTNSSPWAPGRHSSASAKNRRGMLTDAEVRRLERENIQRAIVQAGGKIYGRSGAAGLLGLKPTTLTYRMKALGIPRPLSSPGFPDGC